MRSILSLASIICALAGFVYAEDSTLPQDIQYILNHFSKSALRAHMAYLADDLFEGRGTGTRGQELAAKYVAAEFEAAGVEPGGVNGAYLQNVPMRQIRVTPARCEFSIARLGRRTVLQWGDDFAMNGNPLSPDETVEAPVVFVGFGVVARERNYDDYAGIDVKGKIVAILAGAPATLSVYERAYFSAPAEKAREAAARGAVGIISLRTPNSERILPWRRSLTGIELPSFRWLDASGIPNDTFKELKVTAIASPSAAPRLFDGAQKSWTDALRDAAASKPQAFPLPFTARLHVVSEHHAITSPNVVAVLRGSDSALANEYVVYTAHTDHVGIGRPVNGDSIYNGAVDDASGVSALIEMARAFKSLPKQPKRSILFLALTCEEKGLLGSDYFAHFPTVPIRNIVANINMDGASAFYTFRDIVPIGADLTTLDEIVARDAARLGLEVSPDPMPEQASLIRGDQYSFIRQGVPAVSISEGFKATDPSVDGRKVWEEWIETRYHAPSDDMQQPLNFDATIQFMQVCYLIGNDLAQHREVPKWKQGTFFGNLYAPK